MTNRTAERLGREMASENEAQREQAEREIQEPETGDPAGRAQDGGFEAPELSRPKQRVEIVGNGREVAVDLRAGRIELFRKVRDAGRIEARGEGPGSDLPRLEAQPGHRVGQADRVDRERALRGQEHAVRARHGQDFGEDRAQGPGERAQEQPEGVADVVLRRRDDEAEDSRRPELFPDLEEELPGVVAVDLGRRRFGEIEQDGVVAVGRPLEERPPVRVEEADAGIVERGPGRAGQVFSGQPDDGRIELDAVHPEAGIFQRFGRAAARPAADEEDAANGVPLQEREVDGLLRGPGVRMAEDGQAVVEEGDLLLVPDRPGACRSACLPSPRGPRASTRLFGSPGRIRPEGRQARGPARPAAWPGRASSRRERGPRPRRRRPPRPANSTAGG